MGDFSAGDGISDNEETSLGMQITIATLAGITWYNAFELMILLFVTFAQYRGLYFWSLFISSSVGLIPYSLGFLLKFFKITDNIPWLPVTLLTIGWWCMVTGQSVVLYSRLHLVLSNRRALRRVLIMIVINAVILHLPTTALTYGANMTHGATLVPWEKGYNIMEKIQMTGFCLQEFIISGLYIWETVRMLRLDPDRTKRKIQYQLLGINFIIIILDLGVIYSIKLKLEFAVLGKLIHLVHNNVWKPESFSVPSDFPDFVDATRMTSDVTHAAPSVVQRRPSRMDADDISIAMFEHLPPDHSDLSNSWSNEAHAYHVDHLPIDFTNPFCRHSSRRSCQEMSRKPG
ncbi:unnamed protein product [Penicillium glandicola]